MKPLGVAVHDEFWQQALGVASSNTTEYTIC